MFKLHCEFCNYTAHKTEEELKGMFELKRSPIPLRIPNEKDRQQKYKPQTRKFRCPKCGRHVSAKEVKVAENNAAASETGPERQ